MQKLLQKPSTGLWAGLAHRLKQSRSKTLLFAGLLGASWLISPDANAQTNTILTEGFESGLNGWILVNGTETNQFIIGTAAFSAGAQSAYVSNDAGVTNAYTVTNSSIVHLYKDITIPAAQKSIQLTFKWRTVGEGTSVSDYDNLKVYLTSPNTTIAAGTELPIVDKIGAQWYNNSSATAYTTATISLPTSLSGTTKRLVFSWKNDQSSGSQPPVSIDEISFTSANATPLSGVYTINNTLPTGGTNFTSFTDAVTSLNSEGISGPVTFNVSAGQTFTENVPVIIATGTAANPILFTKSGTGANPIISAAGTTGSTDAGIAISGGDYFTFDGIDVNISTASALEYGYLVRNASATDGATNNTIKNARISLNKANTSSIGLLQTSGSTGGGTTPAALAGSNRNNTYHNLIIENVYNGILLNGGSGTFADNNNQVHTSVIGAATANNLAGGTTTAYGIKATLQNNVKLYSNEIRNITTTTAAVDGLFLDQGLGLAEIYNNNVHDLALSTATGTAVITGMRINTYTSTNSHATRVYNNFITGLNHPFVGTATTTRRIIGMYVQSNGSGSGNTHNIGFNSIRIEPAAAYTASSTVFEIGTTSGPVINVRNNIFANFSVAQTGVAKHYTWVTSSGTLTGNTGSVSDNNLLYIANSTNGFIGLTNTTDQATISNWRAATSQDVSSRSSDPQFISATDLHISPGATTEVESAGSYFNGAITWVTTDFDGNVRNTTTPDIGADEGTFVAAALTPPGVTFTPLLKTHLLTNRTLTASIASPVGIPVTGALVPRIYFQKGTTGTYYSTAGTLASGNGNNGTWTFTIDNTLMGGVAAGDVINYYVIVQDLNGTIVSNTAGVVATDVNTVTTPPATPYSYVIQASFAGTVNVGTGQPFTSLTNTGGLFEQLNNNVLVGNLIVNITSDLTAETGTVALNQLVEDVNGNYTVTIQADAATNRTISGSYGGGLIRFNGADRITIDGRFGGSGQYLTFANTYSGSTTNYTVQFQAGSHSNTLRNTVVKAGANTSGFYAVYSSGNNNDLIIQDNTISKAYYGIYIAGSSSTSSTGNKLNGNTIGSQTAADYIKYKGIYTQYLTTPEIIGNTVFNVITSASDNPAGIELSTGTNGAQVNRNKITGIINTNTGGWGAYGITITAGTGNTLANNMISNISTYNYSSATSTYNAYGIRIEGGTNHKLYYNSVSLGGPLQAPAASFLTAPLNITSSSVTGLDIRNNIFSNTHTGTSTTGKAYAIYAASGTTFADINHNDYFVSGPNGVLGYLGSNKATLADWRSATTKDNQSISVDPLFISLTDLHVAISNIALNNTGTPIASVTTDFDGETRDASNPDIGADEFTPPPLDIAPSALATPDTKLCYTNAEPVSVTIKNQSGSAVDFSAINVRVTTSVTVPAGATAPTFAPVVLTDNTLNNATPLAPGATINVPMGTLDMTTPGNYTFTIITKVLTGGIDSNIPNDTIRITRTLAPVLSANQTVDFTGFTGANLTTLFPNWKEANGVTPTGTTSAWANSGAITGSGVTAKINLASNTKKEWIVGPKFAATATTALLFKAAITDAASANADPAGMQGTDDKVQVMVSADCGLTFTPVYTFDAASTVNLKNTLEQQFISLSAYAGQDIIVAFFATEGTVDDTPDYDFHIDDIFLGTPPAIELVTTALTNPITTGCYGTAENVTISVRNLGSTTLDFTTTPATAGFRVTGAVNPPVVTIPLTGTLAPGASQNVVIGTLNMTTAGTYNIRAFTSIAGDANTANDTITTSRTVAPVAALPQNVNFTGFTGSNLTTLFPNWYEASGDLPGGTTSSWTNSTGLGDPTNVTAKINLYSNTKKEWIVGPKIVPTATTELRFKVAITDYASLSPDPAGMQGTDDKVQVMVSTNCGLTFTPVYTFNAANTTTLTNVLTDRSVSLGTYAGQQVIVAFYASEGVDDTPDYDFHIDEIEIRNIPAIDTKPVKLITAKSGCGLTNLEQVCVVVKNDGSAAQSNIPVSFRINNGTPVNEVIAGPLQPGDTIRYCFTGKANFFAAGTYNVKVYTAITGDAITANDTIATSVVSTNSTITASDVDRCGPGAVTLTATPSNTANTTNWFTTATGGTPVGTGATYSPNITATTTYYVESSSTTENVGLASTTGANGKNTGGGLLFNATQPFTLNSVVVYTDLAAGGNLVINVKNSAGTVIQTKTFTLPAATAMTAVTVPVNFQIPAGTGYTIEQGSSLNLYRESSGVTYPMASPSGAVTITNGTLTNYYYFFYNWSITIGCSSPRIPVIATVNPLPATPTITKGGQSGQELTSSAATGNQWYLNGTVITGATGQTYQATTNGNYTVAVTDSTTNCTSATSASVNITNTGIKDALAGMSVNVYPNPSNGKFNVKLIGYKHDAALELYSLTGQLIAKEEVKAGQEVTKVQVKNLAAGTYLLKVVSEKGIQVSKLIVE